MTWKGVEAESIDTEKFLATQQMKDFVSGGGKIFACGTCLNIRNAAASDIVKRIAQFRNYLIS